MCNFDVQSAVEDMASQFNTEYQRILRDSPEGSTPDSKELRRITKELISQVAFSSFISSLVDKSTSLLNKTPKESVALYLSQNKPVSFLEAISLSDRHCFLLLEKELYEEARKMIKDHPALFLCSHSSDDYQHVIRVINLGSEEAVANINWA